jgi:transcriptional regulator with XRE-family HTH domain
MSDIDFKIKMLREGIQRSQADLSSDLGVSQTTLSNIENGTTKAIDITFMDKVCRYFNKSFEYFLNDAQNNTVYNNEGGVVGNNYGVIHNFSENILQQVKLLIRENERLRHENSLLKKKQ